MTSNTLSRGSTRGASHTALGPNHDHAHRFIMETLEAAMRRQPDVPYGERKVLGTCNCGATTQAKAFFGAGYDLEDHASRPFEARHQV